MAIIWTSEVTVLSVPEKEVRISVLRTDDQSGDTWSYTIQSAVIETVPQKAAIADQIWGAWLDHLSTQADYANIISDLEDTLNTNLMNRES